MDNVAERKRSVLKRLEKESQSLSALKDLTNRSSTVAGGMVNILDSFEHRLAKLETTILPVYKQTGNLQRRHQNIDKTLAALDHVLSFYNAAGESESIIRGGRPGECREGIRGYINAMNKLSEATRYFETHNPHSVELSNVNTLFEAGSEALGREFRDELMKYQRPLNPIVVLELIDLEGDEISEEALSNIELIPSSACDDLALIATWLDDHNHSDKLIVYAKIRSQSFMQSLQALKDHQRTSSGERGTIRGTSGSVTPGGPSLTPGGSMGGAVNSPALTLRSRVGSKLDSTPKSRSNKLSSMLERKANLVLQKAKGRPGLLSGTGSPFSAGSLKRVSHHGSDQSISSSSRWSRSTLPAVFRRRSNSPSVVSILQHNIVSAVQQPIISGATSPAGVGAVAEEALDVTEVLLYLTQVTGVIRLGLIEQRLLQQIVPSARHANTLEILLRTPIEQLATQGEHVSSCTLKTMQRGDSSSVLCLLMLLRHLAVTQPEFERLLHICSSTLNSKYTNIIIYMQNTVVQCLELVMDSVRGEGTDRALPKDGTVHQQTSNMLVFLQQLQEYTTTLGPILVKDATLRSSSSVTVLQGEQLTFEQSQALLAAYFKRVLSNLGTSIVQRSEAYSDSTLRAVFRLNNYNYLLSSLLSTGIMAILELVEPGVRQHYHQQILQQKKLYLQSWNNLVSFLNYEDDPSLSQLQVGRLRDRDKQVLKDRFSAFNKEIEDMQRTQRCYSIPDRKLRDSIKRDNKEFILPKYQAFYDRFSNVPFSRSLEKYVKYSPAEVTSLMDKFFDVAA